MLRFLYKTRVRRIVSFYLLIAIFSEILYPTAAMALTSGPSTPEVQSFEPISTSEMVDLFTGDFKYNIPLMDVGGYPLNIAYNSGISTDQEASWVGLGWNLNAGNITRGMRGIPDDFDGTDVVQREFNMKPNRTYGINAGLDFELFGYMKTKKPGVKKKIAIKPKVGIGINYNNYKGFGVETSISAGISSAVGSKGSLDASLGLHSSTSGGLDISPNISYSARSVSQIQETDDWLVKRGGGQIGGTVNTRAGLKQLNFSASYSKTEHRKTSREVPGDNTIPLTYESNVTKNIGSGHTINFGLQSYVPHISMPMINNSIALSVKTSFHFKATDFNLTLSGYYASQKLAVNSINSRAFGYMYAEKGQNRNDALMDFNREKDGSFSRFTKNLPVSNFTYDVYSASGQGVGGTFRPFRHDVGHVFDSEGWNVSDSYSLGGELGGGDLFKGGIDYTIVDVLNKTGKWTQKNKSLSFFNFKDKSATQKEDETYYFRAVGEKIADNANSTLYTALGGEDAFAIKLTQNGSNSANIQADNKLVRYDNASSALTLPQNNTHTSRQKRNQNFTVLTYAQAKDFGLQKNYYNTSSGVTDAKGQNPAKAYIGGTSTANTHHIGEVTVLNNDGGRYIYGLPAYNTYQKDVSFNISGAYLNCDGLTYYDPADASLANSRGTDNNFSSTTLPPFAYSYLLTAVVSADYVDLTGNGPTDDDLGTYTKFHYKKVTSTTGSAFKWRAPIAPNNGSNPLANYNEGSKSKTDDQSGNYTYGEKELWFLNEIETKNYIAVFETSNRTDAQGVDSEHSKTTTTGIKNQRLDKIKLYSKPEYLDPTITTPVPIKTVHFVYDYSLCQGTYNSGSGTAGKLTLKEIYFTYGKSDRARFNNYGFTYNSGATKNPNYHPKAYDRWGNYKPVPSGGCATDFNYGNTTLTNGEFPYTDQTAAQNDYAQAWHLIGIKLPSGGEINMEYESDDYAFVQNFPAGQMFKVIDAQNLQPTSASSNTDGSIVTLFTNGGSSYTNYHYLIVNGIDPSCTNADFRKRYMKDLCDGNKKVYFRFLVNLTSSTAPNPNFYEYVTGYADIDVSSSSNYGVLGSGQGFFKVKNVNVKRQNAGDLINPIALAAIQFGRLNYGNAVWGGSYTPPGDVEQALKQLANEAWGSLKTMVTGFKNPNKTLADKEYCSKFVAGKSMVRLYNGTGKKLGGGSRVKRLELVDKWSQMTQTGSSSQENTSYKQKFDYDKMENGQLISSGVASYEPMIGSDENSMKQPLYFGSNKWTILAPDDRYFTEGPYGESFYPSPSVGYDKVTVTTEFPANVVTDQKNGKKVYEFYTAKDYPTLTESTPIIPKQHRPPLGGLIKIMSRDFIYTSQGFVVKTNDMHGKPKAEIDYAQGNGNPIRETRFFYKTRGGSYGETSQIDLYSDASYSKNELDNVCKVIFKDGTTGDKPIGLDFDAVADFRESETNTTHIGAQNNLATFLVGVFPGVFPTVWPSFNKEISRFRSAVLTKVINQYGILERVQQKENGAIVETQNLAFDSETGEVLVTKTKNAFSDDIFSLKYPSHWGYDLMGQAYKNVGIELSPSWAGNVATISGASTYLNIGDEVGLSGPTPIKAWVCSVSGNNAQFIDVNGTVLNGQSNGYNKVKVIRSARRNLISYEMATLTSLENPLPTSGAISISGSKKILNASSILYSDKWQMPKGVVNTTSGTNCSCSVSQTGTELLNVLENLFNRPNNAVSPQSSYLNAFFNGAVHPVLNSTNQQSNYSCGANLYAQNTTNQANIPAGFQAGILTTPCTPAAPNWCNYGFTQNLLNQMPAFAPSYNWGTTPPWVHWAGPGKSGNPFNTSNQLIGYFFTDDPRCYLTIDFGPGSSPWNVPGMQAWIKNLALPSTNPASTSVDLIPSSTQNACAGNAIACTFNIYQTSNSSNIYYSVPVTIVSSCLNTLLGNCSGPNGGTSYQCGKLPGEVANPFAMGLKGNWRPKIVYSYLIPRTQNINSTTGNTNTRTDGYFTSFSPLYSPNGGASWNANITNWTNTLETSKYDQSGTEIENKDALGRYSSAQYGYNQSLPVAMASNAQLREIAYDGFEDYSYYPATCNREPHFNFAASILLNQAALSSATAHTGKFSLRVLNNNSANLTKKVSAVQQQSGANNTYCGYVLADHDFIYPFSPVSLSPNQTGAEYVVSYWVKQDVGSGVNLPNNYLNSNLTVSNASGFPFTIKNLKRSPIIDGWQKEEYTFMIPINYSGNMLVKLNNTSGQTAYFDDIRIHPYTSNMKSYVYHPVTLKYVAELDANNYATFYEYDDQGNLVRVKKETEKGIMTIQESKTHFKNIQ